MQRVKEKPPAARGDSVFFLPASILAIQWYLIGG
jgi:hypothetical protein